MSTEPQGGLADWSARMHAQNEYAGERGKQWAKHYDEEFKRVPKGTAVVINCRTGEYVLSSIRRKAIDDFQKKFGKDAGYLIEIGGGTFVGGGFG
jgi:hypothetical protein